MIGIFIPFRNRNEHLKILLDKLKKYDNISIHILEQSNNDLFNRGKLFNIGAKEYLNKYDYFIFHDVDLIPLDENYNEIFEVPTHLSCFCEQFNYKLLDIDENEDQLTNYLNSKMFGGVIGISKNDFEKINGYSNLYEGWGCEDNDLFNRIEQIIKKYTRRPYIYNSLEHESSYDSELNPNLYNNLKYLDSTIKYIDDGLNQLKKINNNIEYTSYLEYTFDTKNINENIYHHNINFKSFYDKDLITIYINELDLTTIQTIINLAYINKKSILLTSSTLSIPIDLKYYYNNESYILKTCKQFNVDNKLENIKSWTIKEVKECKESLTLSEDIVLSKSALLTLSDENNSISYLIYWKDLETVINNNYNYSSINYKEQEIEELITFNKFMKNSNSFIQLKYTTPLISKKELIKNEEDEINIRIKYNFNYYIYYLLNDDLCTSIGLLEIKLTNHFISSGLFEERLFNFNLPLDFDYRNYYDLNLDLRFFGLDELSLSKHYIKNGKNELRKYKIDSQYIIKNIDLNYFKFIYNFDSNKTDIDIINYLLDNKDNLQIPLLNYNTNTLDKYIELQSNINTLDKEEDLILNRVLIITHPGGGGVEKYLDCLKKKYINNIILRPNCNQYNIYQLEIDDKILYYNEKYLDDLILNIYKFSIKKIIINHISIFTPQFLQIFIDIKKKYNCKIILILHDFSLISILPNINLIDIENFKKNIDNPYYNSRLKILEHINIIISPSNYIKQEIIEIISIKKQEISKLDNIFYILQDIIKRLQDIPIKLQDIPTKLQDIINTIQELPTKLQNILIYKLYHLDIKIGDINKNIIINNLNNLNKKIKILIIGNNKGIDEIIEFEKVIDENIEIIYLGENNIISNKIINYSQNYLDDNIKEIIDNIKPDIFWFPSKIPETYCYALSHPIILGYPIIAYNIGSFTERLFGRKMTWLLDINDKISDHINKIIIEYKDKKEDINNIEYVIEYEKKIINEIDYFNYFV